MKKTNEKKNSKGITLVSLVVTIALMLIIISTTGYVSFERFKINKFNKMKTDIELLSDKVKNYYLINNEIPVVKDNENNPIEYTYTLLDFEKNESDNENYYIINLSAMENISLNYGKEGFENINQSEDVYIINEKTHQIYYVMGVEVNNIIYHTLQNEGETNINDDIPPTKPQIKIISGEKDEKGNYISDVYIEIIPGKDNVSGIEKTTYSINDGEEKEISTLDNNILTITDNGAYNIKVRSYDKSDKNNFSEYTQTNINIRNTSKFFITKWNVTLGETEGSETYSTVVLPVSPTSEYDATIYWGDGTSTQLQHNTNGVTLTDAELIEKVTHNYTLAENDDAIRAIEIEGIYTRFSMDSTTSVPTKLKLIGIEQWGNTGFTNINFSNCTNLGGIIPKNDLIELTSSAYCFNKTSIIGLEEGFHFTGGTSLSFLFAECSNLKNLPDDFTIPESVTHINHMFYNCTNLQTIPNDFKIPVGVTDITMLFGGNRKLKGSITILGNPETYKQCFENTAKESGSILTVNYSKNCTNIDDILATGDENYVVKGSPID